MTLRPKTDVVAEWLWEREFDCRRGRWREQPDTVKDPWRKAACDLSARLMDFGYAVAPHPTYARTAVAPFEHDFEPGECEAVK